MWTAFALLYQFHSIYSLSACKNANSIYDVMIVQSMDGTYTGSLDDMLVAIPPERNTLELRTAAYEFFYKNYGLDFDAAVDTTQSILNESISVAPMAINEAFPYRINALDDQTLKTSFQNYMQTTNVIISDIVYMVSVADDVSPLPTHETNYGVDELVIGDGLVYGTYRILINGVYNETVMPDIVYYTSYGEVLRMEETPLVLACALEHEYFGKGQANGVHRAIDNGDGTITLNTRLVQTYPASFSETGYVMVNNGKGCSDLCQGVACNDEEGSTGYAVDYHRNFAFLLVVLIFSIL